VSSRPNLSFGVAAAALLLSGCGDSAPSHDDEHGHGHHDHDNAAAQADHGHGEHEHADPTAPGSTASASPAFAVGSASATLAAAGAGLRLTLTDSGGAPVSPSGEARVVLTGTGEEPQRVVLRPDGEGWSGSAKATGAPGYIAVVSVELGGHTETGRTSWGSVPRVETVPKPGAPPSADHDGEHGHGHGH
jgi:hypothetical protein